MEPRELRETIGKPQMARLKALGTGIQVGRVLGNRVLVRTVEPWTEADEVEKKGLIVVPEAVKKANTPLPTTGVVVAVGEGHSDCSFPKGCEPLREGDMVMFSKFAGMDFMVEKENFRIVNVEDILCTLVDVEEVVTEVAV